MVMLKTQIKLALLGCSVVLWSCGEQNSNTSTHGGQTQADNVETGVFKDTSSSDTAIVHLYADDAMRFNLKEIRVKAGKEVMLVLKHTGEGSKTAMGHNFVLLKPEVNITDFAADAAVTTDGEYIPEKQKDNIIAHTRLLGGGETDTVYFTTPAAGNYPFICSFPGHASMMKGALTAE